jgi:hypothetical protein
MEFFWEESLRVMIVIKWKGYEEETFEGQEDYLDLFSKKIWLIT